MATHATPKRKKKKKDTQQPKLKAPGEKKQERGDKKRTENGMKLVLQP